MTSALTAARRTIEYVRVLEKEKRRVIQENASLRARIDKLEAALAASLKES